MADLAQTTFESNAKKGLTHGALLAAGSGLNIPFIHSFLPDLIHSFIPQCIPSGAYSVAKATPLLREEAQDEWVSKCMDTALTMERCCRRNRTQQGAEGMSSSADLRSLPNSRSCS